MGARKVEDTAPSRERRQSGRLNGLVQQLQATVSLQLAHSGCALPTEGSCNMRR